MLLRKGRRTHDRRLEVRSVGVAGSTTAGPWRQADDTPHSELVAGAPTHGAGVRASAWYLGEGVTAVGEHTLHRLEIRHGTLTSSERVYSIW